MGLVNKDDESKYDKDSKERLFKIIAQKIKTTMIGALDSFEYMFSEQLKDPDFNRSFQEARKEILDNGNNQIRAVEKELENHTVHWNRYTIVMPVKGRGN